MSRLLIVHHTPSPHCQEMLEAVVGIQVEILPARVHTPLLADPFGMAAASIRRSVDGSARCGK